jgi:hypothetical protein
MPNRTAVGLSRPSTSCSPPRAGKRRRGKAELAKERGRDGIVEAFLKAAVWGTPDRILRELEERRAAIGEFELCTSFRFGGTPYELAERSLRLYAKEVLPVVKSWDAERAAAAAQ